MSQVVIKDGTGSPIEFYNFKGKYFPLTSNIGDNLLHLPDMPCRDDDVIILTYPKAGTNWCWETVDRLYTGDGETSNRRRFESWMEDVSIETMTALPSTRLFSTHLTPEFYPKDLIKRKCNIIFVQRNPKDIYASYYHFSVKTKMYGYDGKWKGFFDMIMDEKITYGGWFGFTKEWEDFFTRHPDVPVLRLYYEDMKLNFPTEIEKIAHFLRLPCSRSFRDKVAENCGFEAMKKENTLPKEILDTFFIGGKNPLFRKGIIGDWKNQFTVAQNERFDEEYKRRMRGFTFTFEQYM